MIEVSVVVPIVGIAGVPGSYWISAPAELGCENYPAPIELIALARAATSSPFERL
jgi:hypothetical protein